MNYPPPAKAKLSVVIPAYNAEQWIVPTLNKLWQSLGKTNWGMVEIIVVDDGSSDKTAQRAAQSGVAVKVISSQRNLGRFLARKSGIEAATGDYIFFIDSRVFAKPGSFKFLAEEMAREPRPIVWNGHIEIDRRHNPVARFWYAVTFIAWRRYMAKPRRVHYGLAELERYPKGTTAFFAPRDLVIKAYDTFSTKLKDLRFANDDTALIRIIAAEADLNMDPRFAFIYHYARSSLTAFVKHTFHRGIVFIDGFMHRGSRYFPLIWLYLVAVPISIGLIILYPLILVLAVPLLIVVFLAALALRVPLPDAWALTYVMPLFAIFYTAGLYKGVLLKIKAR